MITRLIAVLIVLALSACNSSSSSGTNAANPVSVLAVSGVMVSLNGNYSTGCRQKSGVDVIEVLNISGTSWSYTRSSFPTADKTCGGAATTASTIIATLASSGSTGAISGWSDSGVAALNPPTADGSGSTLSTNESYTALSLTALGVTGAATYNLATTGDSVNFYYIVDDTGPANVLYIPDFGAVDHMANATPSGSFIKI